MVSVRLVFVLYQQDTLIGLRHQLDEVKAINVEMYQKMQVRTHTLSFHIQYMHSNY